MGTIFRKFTFINYLDFVQNQEFPNKKAEKAFKELFYRVVEKSGLFDKCEEFVTKNIQREKSQIKEQIPFSIQNAPDKKLVKMIKKHLFGNKVDYTLLFHFEVFYLCHILNVYFDKYSRKFYVCFDYSDKQKEKIWREINNFAEIKNKKTRASFDCIQEFIKNRKKYEEQKVFNIAVCATMSAGKSTFVNALLGNDYLPARNEATTAKITSVYDNDAQKKMIGFAANGKTVLDISDNLQVSDIDKWNADSATQHIYLQADLDSICSDKVICAVHDTPGTNNSADSAHKKATMEFLTNNAIDMIIFVANATQLETTDERTLLTEIHKEVAAKKNIPVLFVLNKADEIDSEKEDLNEIIKTYKEYVAEIGYQNATVLPVSAKAARLFKMALKGKAGQFSENECDDFPLFLKKLSKRIVLDETEDSFITNGTVLIDSESYESAAIQTALIHSGLKKIENEISKKIQ